MAVLWMLGEIAKPFKGGGSTKNLERSLRNNSHPLPMLWFIAWPFYHWKRALWDYSFKF